MTREGRGEEAEGRGRSSEEGTSRPRGPSGPGGVVVFDLESSVGVLDLARWPSGRPAWGLGDPASGSGAAPCVWDAGITGRTAMSRDRASRCGASTTPGAANASLPSVPLGRVAPVRARARVCWPIATRMPTRCVGHVGPWRCRVCGGDARAPEASSPPAQATSVRPWRMACRAMAEKPVVGPPSALPQSGTSPPLPPSLSPPFPSPAPASLSHG